MQQVKQPAKWMRRQARRAKSVLMNGLGSWHLFRVSRKGLVPIQHRDGTGLTPVERYWGWHTVKSVPFYTAEESFKYLAERRRWYPLFPEFMQLDRRHEDEAILDYGCGPGHDVVEFLAHSGARKVTGVDVSLKALQLTNYRLAVHQFDPYRIELYQISDAVPDIPLPDTSVDFINCGGVLHHTSDPAAILKEFHRVLRPGGQANIMVYNYNSLHLHLSTAYKTMIIQGRFTGQPIREAFSRNTDGENCPISRCYTEAEFKPLCEQAGFQVEYIGGYLSVWELELLKRYGEQAQQDERLAPEHRAFLKALTYDEAGYPLYMGKYAGVGGVYRLYR